MNKGLYKLGRNEIIRGFGSFESILAAGSRLEARNIAAFYIINQISSDFPVKVGFLMSKKKLKNHTIGTG